MFNPSTQANRAITMQRPHGGAPQSSGQHMSMTQTGPRRSVFDAGQMNPMGRNPRMQAPVNGQIISLQTPSTTKRKGINSMVLDGNSKRPKLDIGGNNAQEIAALRRIGMANSPNVPVLDDANPRIQSIQSTGANGLPMASGMMGFRNPLPMNVNYSRNAGGEAVIYQGLRQPLPSVATMSPSFASSLSNTAREKGFIAPNLPSARVVGANQNPADLFAAAARSLEKNTKSGSPNARITHTVRLAETAAAYAAFAQEKMIIVVPVVTDDGATVFNARLAQFMIGEVDIEFLAFNLAVANYMLALSQLFPMSRDQVTTPDMVIDSFRYGGIVAAEEGPTQSQYVNKVDAHIHRNLVFTTQGEADVFNYWGAVHYGQAVGLIVKGVALKNVFAHHYLDVGTYNIDAMNPAAVRKLAADALSNNPVQLVPWYDKTGMATEPSTAELEYVDDLGEIRLGRWIPVGTVMQLFDNVGDAAHIARSWTSVAATVQSGLIRILVDTTR